MTTAVKESVHTAPAVATATRKRVAVAATNRVRRDGKFFRMGDEKFHVKGVTYGPFAPNADGDPLPDRAAVEADFALMNELGANCLRIYHAPPLWFMDLAHSRGLKIFLDVAWAKNMIFTDVPSVMADARQAVQQAARACGNHPSLFAISVVNEIPPDVVRFAGNLAVEAFVDELIELGKAAAPDCLFTFANFPTTEYLSPRNVDFVCFNVYLHDDQTFRNYLARLQNIAGEKPLMLGEYGIDTIQEYTEPQQAEILRRHVSAVFDEGCAGTFIFSFTDDWFTHGWQIDDWAFGLVRKDRTRKPSFEAICEMFARVPQTTELALPKISVIVCSYNGASTTQSCLASMAKIRYPGEVEVIFVDDGSTDATQEIVAQFPRVVNIRQKNMGLSYARNVGMNAATGQIIIYTDSDCEADEDWLYYIALTLLRSGHTGIGGPNLIPDEGSWVADCVGLSPGGPTHVMVDDRTAEHVPGCNMAFYTWAAKEVGGFDSQFRKAGDDVDFIWRLQHRGYSIGFAPAAQVWHYRRNSIQAYLKQQRGYGEAEALLKYKHPDHFNTLGASHWRGRIYGGDSTMGVKLGRDVIYHGVFGTGLFQTIYRKPASVVAQMLMSVEWHLLAMFVAILGIAFPTLWWVAVLMFAAPVFLAIVASLQAPVPRHPHPLSRALIAYLHWRQPITRGLARYTVRLRAKTMKRTASGYRRGKLPIDPADPRTLVYWHPSDDRLPLLEALATEAREAGLRTRIDSGWGGWDVEVYGNRYAKIRLTSASEKHADGRVTKLRVERRMSTFCLVLTWASFILAGLLLLKLWPFSRPAVLIPLVWWTMYLASGGITLRPVLGMIDTAAEKAGFYPVFPKKKE